MKKIFTSMMILSCCNYISHAQTVLYQNDFSAGASGWQLGQGNNFNTWIVNSEYNCSATTPNQGGGNYMHIYDDLNADYCAVYNILGAGSGGTVYSTMTSGFSTIGQPAVSIQFDWLCLGQTGPILASFGSVDYSTDGGASWINITQPISAYSGQAAWNSQTISSAQIPGLLNQSDVRLRFGFTSSGYGQNPAFSIDNILVTGSVTTSAQLITNEDIFTLSPNASNGILNINAVELITEIKIYDMLGHLVAYQNPLSFNTTISFKDCATGMYSVCVLSSSGALTKKLFIQH